jgi:hypothetical protein
MTEESKSISLHEKALRTAAGDFLSAGLPQLVEGKKIKRWILCFTD